MAASTVVAHKARYWKAKIDRLLLPRCAWGSVGVPTRDVLAEVEKKYQKDNE